MEWLKQRRLDFCRIGIFIGYAITLYTLATVEKYEAIWEQQRKDDELWKQMMDRQRTFLNRQIRRARMQPQQDSSSEDSV